MLHIVLAFLGIVIAVGLTVFLMLKDSKSAPNLKAFGCSAQERDRFLKSRGYRLHLSAKRLTFIKREGIVAAMLIVSLIFTIIIKSKKQYFDSMCIASLIPAAVFVTVMVIYLITFLKKDPAAVTLGKVEEMMIVKGKTENSGRVRANVLLRNGLRCEAYCPGTKTGRENNEEQIRPGEVCFVFVSGDNEILLAADRQKTNPVEPAYDKPQAVNLDI